MMREATSFRGQGDALGLGRGEGLVRYAVGSFYAAVPEIGGHAFVARSPEPCRYLVAGEKREGAFPVQVQRPFQSRK